MPQFSIYDDADQIETVKAALNSVGLDPKLTSPAGFALASPPPRAS